MDFNKTKRYFKNPVSKGSIVFAAVLAVIGFDTSDIPLFVIIGFICVAFIIFQLFRGFTGKWTAPKGEKLDKMCKEYSGNLVERVGKKLDISEDETVDSIGVFGYSLEGMGDYDIQICKKDYRPRSALAVNTLIAFEEDKIEVYMHKFNLKTGKEETSADSILYGDIQDIRLEQPTKQYVKGTYYDGQAKHFAVVHYYTYSGRDIIIPVKGSVMNNCKADGVPCDELQKLIEYSRKN